MKVVLVGMNHTTAPVSIRERVALSGETLHEALKNLQTLLQTVEQDDQDCLVRSEGAILSTCNRLEVYVATGDDDADVTERMERFLADLGGFPPIALSAHLYRHETEEAVHHLLRVAAGLDSMVLGESQILGQVTEAYQIALEVGSIGPILSTLFRQAIHAGKRARTETDIGRHPTSVGNAAVALARQVLGDLKGRCVLLVGAGEMAEVAARNLVAAGASEFRIISRTYTRANELACLFGGSAMAWEQIDEALTWADIVLTSTAAPHTIIRAERVRQILMKRYGRPLFFIDIAVPRNVDPAVAQLPHVYLYDIDDLHTITDESLAERRREVPKVEAIIAEEAKKYLAWLRMQSVVPTLRELRSKAEMIAKEELQKTLTRLPHLSESERRIIAAMTHSIVQKILHEPTVRLKEYASNGHSEYSEALRELFGLNR